MSTKRIVYKPNWPQIRYFCSWVSLLACLVVGPILIKLLHDFYEAECVVRWEETYFVASYSAADVVVPLATLLLSHVLFIVLLIIARQMSPGTASPATARDVFYFFASILSFAPVIGCTAAAFAPFNNEEIVLHDPAWKHCILSKPDVRTLIVLAYIVYPIAIIVVAIMYFQNICSAVMAATVNIGKWFKRLVIAEVELEPV